MFGCESRAAASASRSSRSPRASASGPARTALNATSRPRVAVARLVDDAEAAAPDLPDELEPADHGAGPERAVQPAPSSRGRARAGR